MIFINLAVNDEEHSAEFTIDNGNGKILSSQQIPFTDFPLEKVKLYGQYNHDEKLVIFLPSEY